MKWFHKKYGKRSYVGSYAWGFISDPQKERVFILTGQRPGREPHVCVFESHEAAKRLGWRNV